jgi:hypothetical protein
MMGSTLVKTAAQYLSSTVQRHCYQHEPHQTCNMIFRHWTMKGDSLIDIFSIQYTMEDKGFLRAFFIMNLPKNVFQDINFIFHSNDCSITSELLQNCLST